MAEHPSPNETHEEPPKEIMLAADIAKAYGNGLHILLQHDIGQTTTDIASLPEGTDEFTKPMKNAVIELETIIKALRIGRDIKIVPFSPGHDISYPPQLPQEEPEALPSGELVIEGSVFERFSSAMSHRTNNVLAQLGYAELIPYTMPELTLDAEAIRDDMTRMAEKVLPLFNVRKNQALRLQTDESGNTIMTPIPKDLPPMPSHT